MNLLILAINNTKIVIYDIVLSRLMPHKLIVKHLWHDVLRFCCSYNKLIIKVTIKYYYIHVSRV